MSVVTTHLSTRGLHTLVLQGLCAALAQEQAPEKFLAVLGAAWQSWSHFNPKLRLLGSRNPALEAKSTLYDPVTETRSFEDFNI